MRCPAKRAFVILWAKVWRLDSVYMEASLRMDRDGRQGWSLPGRA